MQMLRRITAQQNIQKDRRNKQQSHAFHHQSAAVKDRHNTQKPADAVHDHDRATLPVSCSQDPVMQMLLVPSADGLCVESGLCKKLVVGLGGPGGAGQFHSLGQAELPRLLVEVTKIILGRMPVLGGVAVVENAYEETARIKAIPAETLIEEEIRLLAWSKSLMPALPTDRLHGLIVEEMGKNFSGTGVDTNIIGRLRITGEPEMERPRIRYVSVLDLSEASHGNATGVGLVDFVTRRLVDKIDRKATYLNNLTTTFVTRAFTPLWFDTERETLETMMFCLRSIPTAEARLVLIPNTLYLTDCYVSEAVLPELTDAGRFEVLGPLREPDFDAQGNLTTRIGSPHTA